MSRRTDGFVLLTLYPWVAASQTLWLAVDIRPQNGTNRRHFQSADAQFPSTSPISATIVERPPASTGIAMNTLLLACLLVSLAAGVMLAWLARGGRHAQDSRVLFALSLAVMIVGLLAVGVVSHTILRHIVQVIPAVIALMLVARQSGLAAAAAAPIYTFWLGVMVNIWLFVLGIARIFSGTFSGVEIALTIIIALASGLGILSIVRWGTRLGPAPRVAIATVFGVAQFAAMVASFQFG